MAGLSSVTTATLDTPIFFFRPPAGCPLWPACSMRQRIALRGLPQVASSLRALLAFRYAGPSLPSLAEACVRGHRSRTALVRTCR